jgi:hypothetical protein
VLYRGSGDGDICFALAKYDELGLVGFFGCWGGGFCFVFVFLLFFSVQVRHFFSISDIIHS